ncbi:hypothetical protein FOL47_008085 [Perkinsus chesapeaki]|uniref:PDZ domain-containing protein n=1 Tax=Perkinsus chesapeaki TaxID=330153 RepID=A0A7J6MUZ8_PERCH|nr:hypothetical protein FOL47_008085 [Perkinsus chesapeaki]
MHDTLSIEHNGDSMPVGAKPEMPPLPRPRRPVIQPIRDTLYITWAGGREWKCPGLEDTRASWTEASSLNLTLKPKAYALCVKEEGGSWQCVDARTGRRSVQSAAAYADTEATVVGLPARRAYTACIAVFMVTDGYGKKPRGWWTYFSDESAPVYLDLFIRRAIPEKRGKHKTLSWPTGPPHSKANTRLPKASEGSHCGISSKHGMKFVCIYREGVAFRNSPQLEDKCQEGVRGGRLVDVTGVFDGWLLTSSNLWLPLRINERLLFEDVTKDSKRVAENIKEVQEAFTIGSVVPGVTAPMKIPVTSLEDSLARSQEKYVDSHAGYLRKLLESHYRKMREQERRELDAIEAFERAKANEAKERLKRKRLEAAREIAEKEVDPFLQCNPTAQKVASRSWSNGNLANVSCEVPWGFNWDPQFWGAGHRVLSKITKKSPLWLYNKSTKGETVMIGDRLISVDGKFGDDLSDALRATDYEAVFVFERALVCRKEKLLKGGLPESSQLQIEKPKIGGSLHYTMKLTESPDRSSTGIGATFDWCCRDDRIRVKRVELGSAARRMGLRPGDLIETVSDMPVDCTMQTDILRMLKIRRPLKIGITRQSEMTVAENGTGLDIVGVSKERELGDIAEVYGCGCTGLLHKPETYTVSLHRESTSEKWGFVWDNQLYTLHDCRVVKDVIEGSIAGNAEIEISSRLHSCDGKVDPLAVSAALTDQLDVQLEFCRDARFDFFTVTLPSTNTGMTVEDQVVTSVVHGGEVCKYNSSVVEEDYRRIVPGCHIVSSEQREDSTVYVFVPPADHSNRESELRDAFFTPQILTGIPVVTLPWRLEVDIFRRELTDPWGLLIDPISLRVLAVDDERVAESGVREDDIVQSVNGQTGPSSLFDLATATSAHLVLLRSNSQVQIYTTVVSRSSAEDLWGLVISTDRLVKEVSGPSREATPPIGFGDCLVSVNGSGSDIEDIAAELRDADQHFITIQLIRCVDGISPTTPDISEPAYFRPPPPLPPIPKKLAKISTEEEQRSNKEQISQVELTQSIPIIEREVKEAELEKHARPANSRNDPPTLERASFGGDGVQENNGDGELPQRPVEEIIVTEVLRKSLFTAQQRLEALECTETIVKDSPSVAEQSTSRLVRNFLSELYENAAAGSVHVALVRESKDILWGLSLMNSGDTTAIVKGVKEGSPAWATDDICEGDRIIAAKHHRDSCYQWGFPGILKVLTDDEIVEVDVVTFRRHASNDPHDVWMSPRQIVVPVVITRRTAQDPWGISFESSTGVITRIGSPDSELAIGDRIVLVGDDDTENRLVNLARSNDTMVGLKVLRNVNRLGETVGTVKYRLSFVRPDRSIPWGFGWKRSEFQCGISRIVESIVKQSPVAIEMENNELCQSLSIGDMLVAVNGNTAFDAIGKQLQDSISIDCTFIIGGDPYASWES